MVSLGELHISREHIVQSDNAESEVIMRFVVEGTDDDAAVKELVETSVSVPTFFRGLRRSEIRIVPEYTVNGDGLWYVDVLYRQRGLNKPTLQFRNTGATIHVDKAIALVSETASSGVPSDRQLVIAEDAEGKVQGIDILVPYGELVITQILSQLAWSPAYRLILSNLTGKVNSNFFVDWPPGEVLFTGFESSWSEIEAEAAWSAIVAYSSSSTPVSFNNGVWQANQSTNPGESPTTHPAKWDDISFTGQQDVTVSYTFGIRKSETQDFGTMTGIAKKGWEIYDVHFTKITDPNGRIISEPAEVYVYQVYPTASFTVLGLNVLGGKP